MVWNKIRTNRGKLLLLITLVVIPLMHTYTLWYYSGEKVDESEIVHYAIGFFGGDLNPHWYGYGGFVMYTMSLAYWLSGIFSVVVGQFDNLSDYLLQIFTSGYFFQLGRYIASVAGLLTIVVYYQLTRKLQIPIVFSLLLLLSYIGAQDAIVYSNYIRSDQFVGLYMALAIYYLSDSSENLRKYFFTSFFIAAAVTSKISSVVIVLVLYGDMVLSYYKGRIRPRDVLNITLFFCAVLIVLSPYQNIFVHLYKVANSTLLEYKAPIGREQYSSIVDRLIFISNTYKNNLGSFYLYTLFLVPFCFIYKRVFLVALAFLLAFILPYLFSNELRDYWFLPTFNLLRLISILAISGAVLFIVNNINYIPRFYFRNFLYVAVVFAYVFFVISGNVTNLFKVYQSPDKSVTNKEMAKLWLEENLVGRARINFDRHWGNLMPKVYDVNVENLMSSKSISRLFIYNRQNNLYLNELFEHYLYERYFFDVYSNKDVSPKVLRQIRIDPSNKKRNGITVKNISICKDDEKCIDIDSNIKFINVSRYKLISETYIIDASNNDSRILIKFDDAFPMDGSYVLSFEVDNNDDYVEVFFDFGDGFTPNIKYQTSKTGVIEVRLVSLSNAGINKIGAVNVNDPQVYNGYKGSYFVTSPAVYNRFKNNSKNGNLADIIEYYHVMTSNELVKSFADGSGHIIEVYKIN